MLPRIPELHLERNPPTQRQQRRHAGGIRRMRRVPWPTRLIDQRGGPPCASARPLIAGLSAHAEPSAEVRKVLIGPAGAKHGGNEL